MIKVVIDSLRWSFLDLDSRFVLLRQENADRFIPVGMTECDFRQLAFRLKNPVPEHIQTYDFFAQLIRQTYLSVRQVYIHSRIEHSYRAQVLGIRPGLGNGRAFAINCRASDALLTAVHFQVPIFVSEPILTQTALSWDEFVSAEKTRIPNFEPEATDENVMS